MKLRYDFLRRAFGNFARNRVSKWQQLVPQIAYGTFTENSCVKLEQYVDAPKPSDSRHEKSMQKAFGLFDTDQSGYISEEKFIEACKELNLPEKTAEEYSKLFKEVDTDQNGEITFDEFKKATRAKFIIRQVAQHREEEKFRKMQDLFEMYDSDQSGHIDYKEFMTACSELQMFDNDTKKHEEFFKRVDSNGDGHMDFDEFHAAAEEFQISNFLIQKHEELMVNRMRETFKLFDKDGSNSIDIDEFILACKELKIQESHDTCLLELFKQADKDGSRCLDFEEFKSVLTSKSGLNFKDIFQKQEDVLYNKMHKAFELFDADQSGSIDFEEFISAFQSLQIPQDHSIDYESLFKELDLDQNGSLDFNEFKEGVQTRFEITGQRELFQQAEELDLRLRETFALFDKDKGGSIDKEEFVGACQKLGLEETRENEFDELFEEVDSDKNGSICLNEFRAAARSKFEISQILTNAESLLLQTGKLKVRDFTDRKELSAVFLSIEKSLKGLLNKVGPPLDDPRAKKMVFTAGSVEGLTCDVTIWAPREPSSKPLPGFVYMHGGGMAICSGKEGAFQLTPFEIACKGAVVMVPHFTNSTERPFPAGLNDCVNSVQWFQGNAERFNLLPNKGVCIWGESGGGNLAITTAMSLRGTNTVSSLFCMCPYTVGHKADGVEESWIKMEDDVEAIDRGFFKILKKEMMKVMEYLYTMKDSEHYKNPYAWPYYAQKEDLEGLPPIMLQGDECDNWHDMSRDFYNKCKGAGVQAWHCTLAGTKHAHAGEMLWRQLIISSIYEFGMIHLEDRIPQRKPKKK